MAYSDFTLAQVRDTFDLTIEESRRLFTEIAGVQPSQRLLTDLNENKPLAIAINSEKARSEFLIAPILAEVRRQANYEASLFSGVEFTVDPEQGLKGFCDYIAHHSLSYRIDNWRSTKAMSDLITLKLQYRATILSGKTDNITVPP